MNAYLWAREDFPQVTCDACREMWESDQAEPDCFDSHCPVGFEHLTDEDLRLLNIRGMLGLLADYGLSERVCRMFDVSDEDLSQLSLLEMECRLIAKEKAGNKPTDSAQ